MAKRHDAEHMTVVFSTYHSIDVISQAQKEFGLEAFDLVVCDEAHRTTGATFGDLDESAFVRIHDGNYIQAAKRLYMTATPRIYGDSAKATAEKADITLCSMDDEALYGKQLYVITFSEAVKRQLLVDYKVLVLAVEESHVSRSLQALLADGDNQLRVDDAAKIVGCWKALAKQGITNDLVGDESAMKRAVAFCQVIEPAGPKAKTHKVSSKNIAGMFQAVVEAYQAQEEIDEASRIVCEAEHVDGSMNASQKDAKLTWLKADTAENTCRILSNVRCLSEGVDVPALDAVLFLTPRNSQVDVVQSVGRVMRNAPGKNRGYVILPVVIPAGVEAHEALNDNKTYAVVWQVLQALRSHDDRFDAMINKLELNGPDPQKMEVIAVCGKVPTKVTKSYAAGKKMPPKGSQALGTTTTNPGASQPALPFEIGEIEKAIYAKVVQKCGNRHHWEDWAGDIAKIARTHIDRIAGILENPEHTEEREGFKAFAEELRDDLNDSITDGEIIEMLAQHLITKPVFDSLFAGYSFATHNPISKAMQGVLDALNEHGLEKETDTLEAFYESVRQRAEGIENAEGKQKIVVELYDKFFRNAFPKMTERLGIVYTPVEVVDFILHSVNHLLKTEFNQTLGSKGVHIIDPFTGTGNLNATSGAGLTVSPSVTTTYTLTNTNSAGTLVTQTATVTVTPVVATPVATFGIFRSNKAVTTPAAKVARALALHAVRAMATGITVVPGTGTTNMASARISASATLLANGQVLIAGGSPTPFDPYSYTDSTTFLTSMELFDPATEAFYPVVGSTQTINGWVSGPANLIEPRAGQASVLLDNGQVLFLGGDDNMTMETFDPATGLGCAPACKLGGVQWSESPL